MKNYKDISLDESYILRFTQTDSNSGNYVCSVSEDMLEDIEQVIERMNGQIQLLRKLCFALEVDSAPIKDIQGKNDD